MPHKWLLIPVIVLVAYHSATAQSDTIKTIHTWELPPPHDFSYEKKWYYINLKKPITATVLEHIPAFTHCGPVATASITIVQTQRGDTLRVIDQCNTDSSYHKGQSIQILPDTKPPFGVCFPFTLIEDPQTGKFLPHGYDLSVYKTTWGILERRDPKTLH